MPLLKGRVLFIGDDLSISTLVVKIINRTGCQSEAVSRKEAINLLSHQDYDCILVDWIVAEDRDLAFYQQVCALAPQSHLYLFTGISSRQEVRLVWKAAREENLSLLDLHSLIAAVDPTTLPLLGKMDNRAVVGAM